MALNYYQVDPIGFEGVSSVTLTPSVDLGTRRTWGGEEYVYVYNDSGGDCPPGIGLVMSGNTGMSVTISGTTFFNTPIGVVKHATLIAATYGWALTRGFTRLLMHAYSSGIVGNPVYVGKDGKFVDLPTKNTIQTAFSQLTSIYGIPIAGVCVQATASAGTGYGYVKCFG
jgi:hypothetical protein